VEKREQTDVPRLLNIGETAARNAGAYLRQKLGKAKIASQKALHDDLLDADLEAEQMMFTSLRQETPQLEILSEETALPGDHLDYWIVDPLDGSANFQHGSPLFAVALALVINHVTTASIIYLPMREEMFTAIRGQGALLNGKRIQVSLTSTLEKAIAHIGDFAKGNDYQATRERINDTLTLAASVYRVRMIGTAASDLAYLACGRADLLVNHATHPWDIEAGKLLLLEAGGKASIQEREDRAISIYSNGIIHQEAEYLIQIQ
jgi:myo-inositol-1(or 4)-monophosphatase